MFRDAAVIEAHQITAVGSVPGEFLPRVLRATGRLVEIVVDPWILVALDEERVEAGARARRPLRGQVDVPQQSARERTRGTSAPPRERRAGARNVRTESRPRERGVGGMARDLDRK